MKLRWPHGLAAVALLIGAAAAAVFCVFEFGIVQRWARNSLVQQLEAQNRRARRAGRISFARAAHARRTR